MYAYCRCHVNKFDIIFLQRPTAKDLLKHKFILKAKKTSYLVELIERYRKWKEAGGKDDSSSSDSEKLVMILFAMRGN